MLQSIVSSTSRHVTCKNRANSPVVCTPSSDSLKAYILTPYQLNTQTQRVAPRGLAPYLETMELPQDIQDMIDDFAFLSDWEERYTHVIDMGKALAPLAPSEKNIASKVKGCVSQVWLVSERNGADDPVISFRGDSDAHIVKGLVAVTLQIFSGRKASMIRALDAADILKQLELDEHLSPQRSNGLKAMIGRIKLEAEAVLKA